MGRKRPPMEGIGTAEDLWVVVDRLAGFSPGDRIFITEVGARQHVAESGRGDLEVVRLSRAVESRL